jgi:hypothetical protein
MEKKEIFFILSVTLIDKDLVAAAILAAASFFVSQKTKQIYRQTSLCEIFLSAI